MNLLKTVMDFLTVIPQLGFDLCIKILGKDAGFFAFIVYFALLVLEMFIPYYLITGFLSALKPEQEKPQEEAKEEPQEVVYEGSFEEPELDEFFYDESTEVAKPGTAAWYATHDWSGCDEDW